MIIKSNNLHLINIGTMGIKSCNHLSRISFGVIQNNWNAACTIYGHAASAVNKLYGGAPWHAFVLTMAIANTTPAPAGNSPTAPLLPTKWAGLSGLATTSITSTVSKLTTVTQTSPSFRHPPMPKYTTNNIQFQWWVNSSTTEQYDFGNDNGNSN